MKNSRIPATEAREQVLEWLVEGATYREISKHTGLTLGTLHKVASDSTARIYESTNKRIAEAFQNRS